MYIEKEKMLPIYGEYDVIVVGGGPAGFGAAYSAAKSGMKTLIIEQTSCIGGMSTAGLMSHWVGKVDSKLFREVLLKEKGRNEKFYDNPNNIKFIDNEKLKFIYLQMLGDVGANILFYTFVSDVVKNDNKIEGVIIENKSGRSVALGKMVIDASGDGDVAYKMGAEYVLGRENDHKMQPVTLMFKLAGVDTDNCAYLGSFESTFQTKKGELQALAKEHLPYPAGHVLLMENPIPGIVVANMTNCIDCDGTDATALTKAEITCRMQMYEIEKFLREFVPGYENCYIIDSASLIGVRETRHFVGLKCLTEDDIYLAKQFDDWAVRGAYFNFDVHNITGSGLDKTGVQHKFEQKNTYTIPYGCLIPKNVENLILAGRCISGTHMAHSNYRAMPICLAMGEAAGYASSIAICKNISLKEVPIKELQERMR